MVRIVVWNFAKTLVKTAVNTVKQFLSYDMLLANYWHRVGVYNSAVKFRRYSRSFVARYQNDASQEETSEN